MATKNCPHCSKQVPVACKKCVCGHTFFTKRGTSGLHKKEPVTRDRERETSKGASSSSSSNRQKSPGSDEDPPSETTKPSSTNTSPSSKNLRIDDGDNPPRRTGRIQREKPNFYDSLEYDRQIKKQKTQLRRGRPKLDDSGSKPVASGGDNSGSGNGSFDESTVKEPTPTTTSTATTNPTVSTKPDEQEPVKRRRGRPPRITTGDMKRVQVATRARIAINNKAKEPSSRGAMMKDGKSNDELNDDVMKDISPEQAAQFNIILEEINRKWVQVGWKI